MEQTLLVVGARKGSLGIAIAEAAEERGWGVTTAGIHGEEHRLDIVEVGRVDMLLEELLPHSVVCTAGINYESRPGRPDFNQQMKHHMRVNATGPLAMASNWFGLWQEQFKCEPGYEDDAAYNFVAISSNSAHVARSNSAAYCASKAALSMGIRCLGRYVASHPAGFNIFGYEPGWIEDTPMSDAVLHRLADDEPEHRIPGGRSLQPEVLAVTIVSSLATGPSPLNGCMIRLDGGEQ